MYKKIMIGMLGMCLTFMFNVSADAGTGTCIKKIGGTCLLWSGSLICGVDTNGLGNCSADPKFIGCTAEGSNQWVVACGNPGVKTWTSPGINVANFEGTIGGVTLVQPEQCDRNGNAYVIVTAEASDQVLADAVAAGACPNDNWTAVDAVPCSVTLTDFTMDANECILSDATFTCNLPNCDTLGWDAVSQRFEQRQYDCTRTSYHIYTCP